MSHSLWPLGCAKSGRRAEIVTYAVAAGIFSHVGYNLHISVFGHLGAAKPQKTLWPTMLLNKQSFSQTLWPLGHVTIVLYPCQTEGPYCTFYAFRFA